MASLEQLRAEVEQAALDLEQYIDARMAGNYDAVPEKITNRIRFIWTGRLFRARRALADAQLQAQNDA